MNDFSLSAYDYHLPESLIAQVPAQQREKSRLLVYSREDQGRHHTLFDTLHTFLEPGDVLVVNNSKVFPARVFGEKSHTGTRFEFLLLHARAPLCWEALAKNSKRIKVGYRFHFPGDVVGEIVEILPAGHVVFQFSHAVKFDEADFWTWIEQYGEIPYPPYIQSRETDDARYQTIFEGPTGSVAAPTAGLHFSDAYKAALIEKGILFAELTLHVGIGTFMPVRTSNITEHPMHSEHYVLPETTAALLNKQRAQGHRIVAVGTTATRTLESVYRKYGHFKADRDSTRLFLYPGQAIQSIDALITNFHLPQSSLLMLVSAFIGRDVMMSLYEEAIAKAYRFYSFGDAMLLL
jgi:S-adenosylmethionine:tRNA ribosyltransferase-isomerase